MRRSAAISAISASAAILTFAFLAFGPDGSAGAAIQRGQIGFGLSVFADETPERFEVEILGQLDGAAATGLTYLARLSGASLGRTGVLQGMSGSPVYIDGELIGAVMSTWSFAKEALCQIRPIAEMRALGEGLERGVHPGYRPGASTVSAPNFTAPTEAVDVMAWLSGTAMAPPLRLSGSFHAQGFPHDLLGEMQTRLGAFVQSGGSSAGGAAAMEQGSLDPGDAAAVLLVDGAARLSAAGTVTARDGDAILAFGHPLLGIGPVSLPLARARVVALMPSQDISFKIAEPTQTVGAMLIDRRAGMLGKLGVWADTLPLHVRITDTLSAARDYEFQLARLQQLLPDLAAWSARAALFDREQAGDDAVLRLRTRIEFEQGEALSTEATVDGSIAASSVGSELALPLALVLAQREPLPRMTKLSLEIERVAAPRRASIGQVLVRPEQPRPGDELRIRVELREDRGASRWEELRLTVPLGEPDGMLQVHVGDGESSFRDELARTPTRWQDPGMATLREALQLRAPASALVAVLYASPRSVIVEGAELSQWPSSLQALLLQGGGRAKADPVAATSIARTRIDTEWRLRGQRVVELRIGEAPSGRRVGGKP